MVGITSQLFGQSKRAFHRFSKTYSLNRDESRRRALFNLGERYLFGREGEKRDPARAVLYFKEAASKGFPLAISVLGFCAEFGMGVETDFKVAERLYIEAASEDCGLGMARLAFLRKYGRPGVKIDRVEAEEWHAKVAERGEECIEWLMKAASEDDDPSAQYALGVCYHDGVAVEKNADEAVKCRFWLIR